jgi:hypothetical protein
MAAPIVLVEPERRLTRKLDELHGRISSQLRLHSEHPRNAITH